MDIIVESVKQVESLAEHGGCADAGVLLDVESRYVICQFEQGVPMTAMFGGRSAVFSTYDPIRANTKISFMFGAPLNTSSVRGAAAAIINVILGFLCMTRILHACPASSQPMCSAEMIQELDGKKVFCCGTMGKSGIAAIANIVENPSIADVILINGEGLISEGTGDLIETYKQTKRIICIGPSTAGIARRSELEHWWPFGGNCPAGSR
jgi:hypothetical protein